MCPTTKTEVLVVGAGPVGLLSAVLLGQRGVRVSVVDEKRRSGRNHYALALHPRSLEILHRAGVAAELVARGKPVKRLAIYEGDRRRGCLSLGESDGRYPFVLVLPQRLLEAALEERLARLNVPVRWKHRLEGLEQDQSNVTAEVAVLDQVSSGYPVARLEWVKLKSLAIEADFVIGADGYDSRVRSGLGIDFRQFSPLEPFQVFELDALGEYKDEARVVLSGESADMLWPMRDERYRWTFHAEGEGEPTEARLNALIRSRAPWFHAVEGSLRWSAAVRFDRRLAERFGRGRAWLVGDAAHLTYPMGNQSLNGGLADADALCRRLAPILRHGGPHERLEVYNDQRLASWRRTLGGGWLMASLPATGQQLSGLMARLGLPPAAG